MFSLVFYQSKWLQQITTRLAYDITHIDFMKFNVLFRVLYQSKWLQKITKHLAHEIMHIDFMTFIAFPCVLSV